MSAAGIARASLAQESWHNFKASHVGTEEMYR
jgi:hypothetical protein